MKTELILFGIQTVITLGLGLVGWSIKNAISDMKSAIQKNAADIAMTRKELNDLKSDLPMIYTLREDFIRTMNNVENKIGEVSQKLDRIIMK